MLPLEKVMLGRVLGVIVLLCLVGKGGEREREGREVFREKREN